jgi:hypothetical protein
MLTTAVDHYLPDFDVRSAHSIEIDAPADVVYRAAREADLTRHPVVAALVAIRTVPHVLTGKTRPSRSLTMDDILESAFVVLEDRPPTELVVGAVGKFWLPTSGFKEIKSEEFDDFDEPGYAKAAIAFLIEERGSGSLLETETRVSCTDPSARLRFSWYWRAIGPFSGLIRKIVLDDIKRSAEKS